MEQNIMAMEGKEHHEIDQLDVLYKEIILEHYRAPHSKGRIDNADISMYDNNPLCGDEITVTARLKDGKIEDIKVDPTGCSISVASASMMTDALRGKTIDEIRKWVNIMKDMMRAKQEIPDDELGDLESLKGVAQFPVRVKCALLAWMTLSKGIEKLNGGK